MNGKQTFLPADTVVIDDIDGLTDEQIAFEEFKESFSAEEMGELKVYRVPQSTTGRGSPKNIYLFAVPLDQYDFGTLLEYLRDNYGGGIFRLIGTRPGKKGVGFNRLVEIEAPKNHPAPPPKHDSENNFISVLSAMQTAMEKTQERTEQLIERVAGPKSVDPMEMMKNMMAMMVSFREVVGGDSRPVNIIDEIHKIKEVSELLGGSEKNSNTTDLLIESVRQFAPAIVAVVQQRQSQPQAQQIPYTVPVQTPQPKPGNDKATVLDMKPSNVQEFTNKVGVLLTLAKQGLQANKVAQMIIDKTPDNKLDDLAEFVEDPNCVAKCIAAVPEASNYQSWFDILKSEMKKLLDEMAEPDEDLQTEPEPDIVAAEEREEHAGDVVDEPDRNVNGDSSGGSGDVSDHAVNE